MRCSTACARDALVALVAILVSLPTPAAPVTAFEWSGVGRLREERDARATLLGERWAAKRAYDELYGVYRELHDGFGGVPGAKADFPSLMKRLLALRERETAH